jgi:hypothetical protein
MAVPRAAARMIVVPSVAGAGILTCHAAGQIQQSMSCCTGGRSG